MTTTFAKPTIDWKDIDEGFYAEARGEWLPAPQYLAVKSPPDPEVIESYKKQFMSRNPQYTENIHLLESDSPLHQWASGRAALAHQLAWYEEKSGNRVVRVLDFYGPDSSITSLFPAYIETEIQAAMLQVGVVQQLIFATEAVTSMKVTCLRDGNAANTRSLKKTGVGAELPLIKIDFEDSTINLYKYGAAFELPYEVIKEQKIDALAHHLRRVAEQVAADETDLALHTLIAGDGTTAGAAESNSTDTDVATAGSIAYSDLLSWYFAITRPYQIDKAVAGKTDLALIDNLAEFKDSQTANLPNIPGPKSVNYIWWDGGVNGSSYVDRLVVGIDSRRALKRYTYGSMLQETDRIIRRQVEQYTMSYGVGFRKFDASAVEVLDCNSAL
jgi:hypothetical protein